MQLALYGIAVFWRAALVAVIYGAGLFGSTYLLPVFMLDAPRIAASTSTMNFLRQLGGAFCVSAVGIMREWRLQTHAALGAAGVLRAFHDVVVLMARVTGLAALATWRMRPPPTL